MFLSSGINFSLSEYCSFGLSVSFPALDKVTQIPSLAQMRSASPQFITDLASLSAWKPVAGRAARKHWAHQGWRGSRLPLCLFRGRQPPLTSLSIGWNALFASKRVQHIDNSAPLTLSGILWSPSLHLWYTHCRGGSPVRLTLGRICRKIVLFNLQWMPFLNKMYVFAFAALLMF